MFSLAILIGRGLDHISWLTPIAFHLHPFIQFSVRKPFSLKPAPLAQLVEHLTLNQGVPGSSPHGAPKRLRGTLTSSRIWLVGQAVKTSASHAENRGSIPLRVTTAMNAEKRNIEYIWQLVLFAMRVHLFPSRTQKLSSLAPKILGWRRPGKIGRCQTPTYLRSSAGRACGCYAGSLVRVQL